MVLAFPKVDIQQRCQEGKTALERVSISRQKHRSLVKTAGTGVLQFKGQEDATSDTDRLEVVQKITVLPAARQWVAEFHLNKHPTFLSPIARDPGSKSIPTGMTGRAASERDPASPALGAPHNFNLTCRRRLLSSYHLAIHDYTVAWWARSWKTSADSSGAPNSPRPRIELEPCASCICQKSFGPASHLHLGTVRHQLNRSHGRRDCGLGYAASCCRACTESKTRSVRSNARPLPVPRRCMPEVWTSAWSTKWCICSGLDAVNPGIPSRGPYSGLDHSVEKKTLVISDLLALSSVNRYTPACEQSPSIPCPTESRAAKPEALTTPATASEWRLEGKKNIRARIGSFSSQDSSTLNRLSHLRLDVGFLD